MGSNFDETVEYGESPDPPPPAPASEEEIPVGKVRKQQPQKSVDTFWEKVGFRFHCSTSKALMLDSSPRSTQAKS